MSDRLSGTSVSSSIQDTYGIKVPEDTSQESLKVLNNSLKKLPTKLVRDCGIGAMSFKDLGPSMEYYPNHGVWYFNGELVLNIRIIKDPKLEKDKKGKSLNKFDLIFYHELGHGLDDFKGPDGKCLSDKPEWLDLSGWRDSPTKGHKQFIIRCQGRPDLVDNWYYAPWAEFPRYYGKRNPWDDWADAFSFYVGGLKDRLCKSKLEYFDNLLQEYYE